MQDKNPYGHDIDGRRIWQTYGNNAGDRNAYDTSDQVVTTGYNLAAVAGDQFVGRMSR
jgi:hypothetical protein